MTEASSKVVWNHDRSVILNLFQDLLEFLGLVGEILKQVQEDVPIVSYT